MIEIDSVNRDKSGLRVGGYAKLIRLSAFVERITKGQMRRGDIVKLLDCRQERGHVQPQWNYLVLRSGFRSVNPYPEWFFDPLTPLEELAVVSLDT
jgi:hypothetical protein